MTFRCLWTWTSGLTSGMIPGPTGSPPGRSSSTATMAIGTEEEILATMLKDPGQIRIRNQQISAPEIGGDIEGAIVALLETGLEALVVQAGRKGIFGLPG